MDFIEMTPEGIKNLDWTICDLKRGVKGKSWLAHIYDDVYVEIMLFYNSSYYEVNIFGDGPPKVANHHKMDSMFKWIVRKLNKVLKKKVWTDYEYGMLIGNLNKELGIK